MNELKEALQKSSTNMAIPPLVFKYEQNFFFHINEAKIKANEKLSTKSQSKLEIEETKYTESDKIKLLNDKNPQKSSFSVEKFKPDSHIATDFEIPEVVFKKAKYEPKLFHLLPSEKKEPHLKSSIFSLEQLYRSFTRSSNTILTSKRPELERCVNFNVREGNPDLELGSKRSSSKRTEDNGAKECEERKRPKIREKEIVSSEVIKEGVKRQDKTDMLDSDEQNIKFPPSLEEQYNLSGNKKRRSNKRRTDNKKQDKKKLYDEKDGFEEEKLRRLRLARKRTNQQRKRFEKDTFNEADEADVEMDELPLSGKYKYQNSYLSLQHIQTISSHHQNTQIISQTQTNTLNPNYLKTYKHNLNSEQHSGYDPSDH